ncbi:mesenchyme-specific cell surface glycoprotein-like isoform X1 [Crassostrea virginica]
MTIMLGIIVKILLFVSVKCENIHLEKISNLFVPASFTESGAPVYSLGSGSAEQLTYDPRDRIVYVVGASKLSAIDVSNVESPRIVYNKMMGNFDPTDVEFCGDHVMVTLDNNQDRIGGRLVVFKKYNPRTGTMETVLNITVGPLPDMLKPTSDCRTILIALEAEAFARDGDLVDPEGGIGLLKFPTGNISADNYSYKSLHFHNFNDRWNELSNTGVRFIYKGQNNTFSQDLEPEYITFSKDEKTAYVCLQENNAIAVVNLETENVTAIHGLGFKNWSNFKLDASDRDNGIHIRALPVYGMYQPDAIYMIKVNDVEYLITANEGDSKDYSGFPLNTEGFSEEIRAADADIAENSEVREWMLQNDVSNISQLLDKSVLGRLQITKETGRLSNGTFEKLYSFGGRGFSIWRVDTMSLVYDSGNDIEDTHAQLRPDLFNAQPETDTVIKNTVDSRSDNKGPESESLTVGHVGNKALIFIGHERPGSISIYSVDGNIASPRFESVYWDIQDSDLTWTHAFNQNSIGSIDPEDLKYIAPNDSPNGRPLLLVAGSVSGTVSILEVKGIQFDNTRSNGSHEYIEKALLLLMSALWFFLYPNLR